MSRSLSGVNMLPRRYDFQEALQRANELTNTQWVVLRYEPISSVLVLEAEGPANTFMGYLLMRRPRYARLPSIGLGPATFTLLGPTTIGKDQGPLQKLNLDRVLIVDINAESGKSLVICEEVTFYEL